jgi:hypothetical protein
MRDIPYYDQTLLLCGRVVQLGGVQGVRTIPERESGTIWLFLLKATTSLPSDASVSNNSRPPDLGSAKIGGDRSFVRNDSNASICAGVSGASCDGVSIPSRAVSGAAIVANRGENRR